MYCWFNSLESYIDRIRIHDEDRINTIKTEFTEPTHKVPIKVHANAENRIDVVNIALPDKVGQGDPEGAMSMRKYSSGNSYFEDSVKVSCLLRKMPWRSPSCTYRQRKLLKPNHM